jgi:uncharacterized protein
MWLADLFSSRRIDRFFTLIQQQADVLVSAAAMLREFLTSDSPELSEKINAARVRETEILNALDTTLRDAFVTPIDRQDIYNLGEALDDMLNYINNAAREIGIFNVAPTAFMQQMAVTLETAAKQVRDSIAYLKSDPQKAWGCARYIQESEALVEDEYRRALVQLFAGSDIHVILKQREVYRHLSNSADRALAIGRLIGKIVVKAT